MSILRKEVSTAFLIVTNVCFWTGVVGAFEVQHSETLKKQFTHGLEVQKVFVGDVAWSGDSSIYAVGYRTGTLVLNESGVSLRLFDTKTNRLIRNFEATKHSILRVLFTLDQKQLVGVCESNTKSTRQLVVFWDLNSGKIIKEVPLPKKTYASPDSFAFLPDGSALVFEYYYSYSPPKVAIEKIDLKTFETSRLWSFSGRAKYGMKIAFANDLMLASNIELVFIVNWKTGKHLRTLTPHKGKIHRLQVSSDGETFYTYGSEFVRVKLPNGRIVKQESKGNLKIWDLNTFTLKSYRDGPLGNQTKLNRISAVSISNDARMGLFIKSQALASSHCEASLWDFEKRKFVFDFPGNQGDVKVYCKTESNLFSTDQKKLILGRRSGAVDVWSIPNPDHLKESESNTLVAEFKNKPPEKILFSTEVAYKSSSSAPTSLHLTSDGRSTIFVNWGHSHIIDLESESEPKKVYSSYTYDSKISNDGKYLFTCSSKGRVAMWDLETRRRVRLYAGHKLMNVFALAITEDGKTLASMGVDESIRVWDVETGKQKLMIDYSFVKNRGYYNKKGALKFIDKGKKLFVITNEPQASAKIFDLEKKEVIREFKRNQLWSTYTYSINKPEKSIFLLAAIDKWRLKQFDFESGKEIGEIGEIEDKNYPNLVNSSSNFSISPDERLMVVYGKSNKRNIHIIDLKTNKLIRTFQADHSPIKHVAFSADGKALIIVMMADDLPIANGEILTQILSWDLSKLRSSL